MKVTSSVVDKYTVKHIIDGKEVYVTDKVRKDFDTYRKRYVKARVLNILSAVILMVGLVIELGALGSSDVSILYKESESYISDNLLTILVVSGEVAFILGYVLFNSTYKDCERYKQTMWFKFGSYKSLK